MRTRNHFSGLTGNGVRPGVLISVEGLSFAGKSTGIHILYDELRKRGEKVVVVEWNAVEAIKRWLNKLHCRGWLTPVVYCLVQWTLCVFVYFRQMRPAIAQGAIVLADRYIHTGLTRDAVNSRLSGWLSSLLYRMVRKPDWILFFSVAPEVCIASMNESPGRSLFYLCKRIERMEANALRDFVYLQQLDAAYRRIIADQAWLGRGGVAMLDGHTDVDTTGIDQWIPAVVLHRANQEIGRHRDRLVGRTTFHRRDEDKELAESEGSL
jgi:dTMP kinase